jgi:hypothetical protein
MANINISDLGPARTDLFLDSESYINDLTEGEMMNKIVGGFFRWYRKYETIITNNNDIDINIHGDGDITIILPGG